MNRLALIALVLVGAGLFGFVALTWPRTLPESAIAGLTGDPVRGATMFYAGGCASCHAAPDADTPEDKLIMAGGLALKTDFGTFVAPNISSDPDAGIGAWTARDFVNAMVRGVSPDGAHYYPAFPYTSYQRMTLQDVVDLYAFMKTLPASSNVAADHDLGFPFTLRRGLGLWKRLYLDGETYIVDANQSEQWNRGAYLVTGPAHCGECHTPRTAFGGMDESHWLAGAPNPDGEGRIPNITPHSDGIGSWSQSDIAYSLESGFTPEFDSFGGSMAKVVQNTAQLTPEDRAAMAAYLATVPPRPDTPRD